MSKVKDRRRASYPDIVAMRANGLTWAACGAALGVAGTTAKRWFYETLAEERSNDPGGQPPPHDHEDKTEENE